jgi:hypothetical protein
VSAGSQRDQLVINVAGAKIAGDLLLYQIVSGEEKAISVSQRTMAP